MSQPLFDYLKNKEKQEQTPFKIVNGNGHYLPRQNPIPKKEYEEWYPMGGKIALWNYDYKGENPDKTWIG